MTIGMPKVHQAPRGLFYQWLKGKDKLGGQHKVPRLSNKGNYLDELLEMSQSRGRLRYYDVIGDPGLTKNFEICINIIQPLPKPYNRSTQNPDFPNLSPRN